MGESSNLIDYDKILQFQLARWHTKHPIHFTHSLIVLSLKLIPALSQRWS